MDSSNKTSMFAGNLKSQWSHAKDSTLSKMKRAAQHLASSMKNDSASEDSQDNQNGSSRKHLPYQMYMEPLSPSVNASMFPFAQEGTAAAPAPDAEALDHQGQDKERREAMEAVARSWEQARNIGTFARDSTTMELCALPAAKPTRYSHGSTHTRRPKSSPASTSQVTTRVANPNYRNSWSPTCAVEPLYTPRHMRASTGSSSGYQETTPAPDSDNGSDDGEDDGIYLAQPVSY